MPHLLGRERGLRQQCRRGRLPVRPAAPDRQGEQASYAGITIHLQPKTNFLCKFQHPKVLGQTVSFADFSGPRGPEKKI